jgi:hypothetical protein
MAASTGPSIGSVTPTGIATESNAITFWAENVKSSAAIARVWAVVKQPGESTTPDAPVLALDTIEMEDVGGSRYKGSYEGLTTNGLYQFSVFAKDSEGKTSLPEVIKVCKGCDTYENDDTYSVAGIITLNDSRPQRHNFHDAGDQDWVTWYGLAGERYTIQVSNVQTDADPVIELYDTDGTTLLKTRDDENAGQDESMDFQCSKAGIYYVKIRQADPV